MSACVVNVIHAKALPGSVLYIEDWIKVKSESKYIYPGLLHGHFTLADILHPPRAMLLWLQGSPKLLRLPSHKIYILRAIIFFKSTQTQDPLGGVPSWLPYSIGNVNWVGGGNPSRYVAKCLSAYFGQEGAIWTNFFAKYPCLIYEDWICAIVSYQGVHI